MDSLRGLSDHSDRVVRHRPHHLLLLLQSNRDMDIRQTLLRPVSTGHMDICRCEEYQARGSLDTLSGGHFSPSCLNTVWLRARLHQAGRTLHTF